MTVVCLCIFVLCIWVDKLSIHTTTVTALDDLTSSYEYFNMNRGFSGIRTVESSKSNVSCALGIKEEKLYRWVGSISGHGNGGKCYLGVSSLSTDPVLAVKPYFYSNYWKGAYFCFIRQTASTMKRRATPTTVCAAAN